MKSKRKMIYSLILLSLLMLLVTACGSKKTEEVTTEEVDITAGFENVSDYVQTVRPDTVIYRMPDETSEVYSTLKPGVDLMRTGVLKEWTRIRLNDTTLYVKSENVKKTTVQWVEDKKTQKNDHVVFIDPAKQIYADQNKEAIVPGGDPETQGKARMARASVGTATGSFEYDITLSVADRLKHELELRGYTVILSRESGTTSISNSERAIAGNQSNAEIMIRITASGSSEPKTKGIYSLIASSKNPNTSAQYQDSFYLSNMLITNTCSATGTLRLGIYQTDQMVFLNYCKKPAAVLQLGFLSNKEDDAKLSDPEYQEKLAEGMADGVDGYFEYVDQR